jgi:hypothetical protein
MFAKTLTCKTPRGMVMAPFAIVFIKSTVQFLRHPAFWWRIQSEPECSADERMDQ